MKPEVIIALDLPGLQEALSAVSKMPPEIRFFKVGLELFTATGPEIVLQLKKMKKRVFLDLKLHDIPNTVGKAVEAAGRMGVDLLTVHASGGRPMLQTAVEAAKSFAPTAPKIIAVTVLTSMDEQDLADTGITRKPADHVLALAEFAMSCGVDGLVASAKETESLRNKIGPTPWIVTPGIRMPADSHGDQKRVGTPSFAVKAGSSHLVVGRSVLDAPDPCAAVRNILKDMGA